MDILEIMNERHSVRQYTEQKIEVEKRLVLDNLIAECNKESGLNMQIIYDDKDCFNSMLAKYGKFKGVANYIAVIGKKSPDLEESAGYFGEKVVLQAQKMGLNTCWVGLTYGKNKCKAKVEKDEKIVCVISLGYGVTQGVKHKNKELSEVCTNNSTMPEWFRRGMEGVMLAPTATNQQKFHFSLNGDKVIAKSKKGFYVKTDLGIVKYHFEACAGKENFKWETER